MSRPGEAKEAAQSAQPWTVRRILEWTAGFFARKDVDQPRLSAELLLSHVLGVPRIKLYTDYDKVLPDEPLTRYRELVKRAGEQEPIAYLTGIGHFFGLELKVDRRVLIPRPETETLVEHVLQLVRYEAELKTPRVLDLCTGSGCVALAIAQRLPNATAVVGVDISEDALAVARENAATLGLADRVRFLQGDLYAGIDALPDPQPFDLILANPPYIRSDLLPELDRSVKDYEPHLALDGGEDGLLPHRRILADAPNRLTPAGRVFLEIAFDQGEAALALAREVPGLTDPKILRDSGNRDRVLYARRG
jgi:release factor glutamine methyltransferase